MGPSQNWSQAAVEWQQATSPNNSQVTEAQSIAEGGLVAKQTEAASRPEVHPRHADYDYAASVGLIGTHWYKSGKEKALRVGSERTLSR